MAWLQGAAGLPMCQYCLVDDSGLRLAVLPGLIDRVPGVAKFRSVLQSERSGIESP
jgi:hypothetical protein